MNHLFLFFVLVLAANTSQARQFVNGDIEVDMYYSGFNSETIPVGIAKAKLRRSDDNFACIVTNENMTYQCTASKAVDNLTWINLPKEDLAKIMLTGLNPNLPKEIFDRTKELIETHLTRPPLVAGIDATFRWDARVFETSTPDVLKLVFKIKNQRRD